MVKIYPHLDVETHAYLKPSHIDLNHQGYQLIFYP